MSLGFPSQAWVRPGWEFPFLDWPAKLLLRPIQLFASAPCFLFLLALGAMLLRHPDVRFYGIDRIAFGLLLLGVVSRAVVLRQKFVVLERATWPMLAITVITISSVAGQSFEQETWSLLASKFVVPFAMFHLAGLVFTEEIQLERFELFCLIVLGYLTFTAIAFLLGLNSLIFPRFILDPAVGAHADRARGPLLQAVANGVSLNLLAFVALHAYRRRSVPRIGADFHGSGLSVREDPCQSAAKRRAGIAMVLLSVPPAIIATMTRAVWLAFAGTLLALPFVSRHERSRRIHISLGLIAIAGVGLGLSSDQLGCAITDRLRDNRPVEFRQAVYQGAWEMFLQRPLMGWGFHQMPDELPRHVTGYEQNNVLYPHNTFLELLAEQGIVGFALYLWLMWELWRLKRVPVPAREKKAFLDENFHRLWPIMLAVYWFNAAAVVMSYQFVNALLFTIAGMLAAQRRRLEMASSC